VAKSGRHISHRSEPPWVVQMRIQKNPCDSAHVSGSEH
jgi:hypothetical protein